MSFSTVFFAAVLIFNPLDSHAQEITEYAELAEYEELYDAVTEDEFEQEDSELNTVECLSKDVWDAGFVLRFSLQSTPPPSPTAQIETEQINVDIFKVVPLWRLERVFKGPLTYAPVVESETCHIKLVDRLEEPTVEIDFINHPEEPAIEITRLNGPKPSQFSKLTCNDLILEEVFKRCQPQSANKIE